MDKLFKPAPKTATALRAVIESVPERFGPCFDIVATDAGLVIKASADARNSEVVAAVWYIISRAAGCKTHGKAVLAFKQDTTPEQRQDVIDDIEGATSHDDYISAVLFDKRRPPNYAKFAAKGVQVRPGKTIVFTRISTDTIQVKDALDTRPAKDKIISSVKLAQGGTTQKLKIVMDIASTGRGTCTYTSTENPADPIELAVHDRDSIIVPLPEPLWSCVVPIDTSTKESATAMMHGLSKLLRIRHKINTDPKFAEVAKTYTRAHNDICFAEGISPEFPALRRYMAPSDRTALASSIL